MLTYTQYITLVSLAEWNHQTVRELGLGLFLDAVTLAPTLKKLKEIGHMSHADYATYER